MKKSKERELLAAVTRHIRQHCETEGRDGESIREVAEQAVEWLTLRGLTRPTPADICDALNGVCWY